MFEHGEKKAKSNIPEELLSAIKRLQAHRARDREFDEMADRYRQQMDKRSAESKEINEQLYAAAQKTGCWHAKVGSTVVVIEGPGWGQIKFIENVVE